MEYGQSVETIISELNEGPVGPVNFAQLQKRDQATSKGLRPQWNNETPRDFSVASDPLIDVDNALFKATSSQLDPDGTTKLIVDDVLRRLASDGDDFRRTDNAEHAENHDDDEPSEDIEFSDAFQEFCARS